jgi:alpha-L-fucosidase
MKKIWITTVMIAIAWIGFSQPYQPNWQSLDARPTPQWFQDAKFGIFIHWGVYAVPGWCAKGNYAEWYQYGLQTTDSARMKFHKEKFGNKTYYQLADDFKAELFNPDDWAKLFERSGAKYIVLTSKHHDGYTLWPDKTANKTWGFPWNASEVGPKRDLLGDLFASVRKTSVRAGMYYSLYEWFNPLWKSDPKKFAIDHTWPQMKTLINTYQPDVFWTDGDWDAPAETWKSQEFLAWLYNDSPVKDKIVVNDRWGSGIRFKHAGIYTPEYQPDLDFEDHYWEESRGMGFSYGYNREEDAWDYNSTQSLVIALVDKVSRGGNFLLDIGPDEHGKIPPIMQERLLQIGEWLNINGEAIYNSSRWKNPVQWSDGRRDYKFKNDVNAEDWKTGGDVMLKLTLDPDPGFAVKEIFFTYNQNTNSLYAIFPRYPDNKKLILRDITLQAGTNVTLLSMKEKVNWTQTGKDVTVDLPDYNPNKFKAPYGYALKIEGYGKFTRKPTVSVEYKPGATNPLVTIQSLPGTTTTYTLNDSAPVTYQKPFTLNESSIIKVKSFQADALPSKEVEVKAMVYNWKKAVKVSSVKPGLNYQAYELSPSSVADVEGVKPVKSGVTNEINTASATRKEQVALRFEGYFHADVDALYQFYLRSDDGSKLWIDDEEVINNDGLHGSEEKTGAAALKKGYHKVRLDFFQATGGIDLKLMYGTNQKPKQEITGLIFH